MAKSKSGKQAASVSETFKYTRIFAMGLLIMCPFAFISLVVQYEKVFSNTTINQPANLPPAYAFSLIWAFCVLMIGLSNVFSFKAIKDTNTGSFWGVAKAMVCPEILFTYLQLLVIIGWSALFFDQLRFFASALVLLCGIIPLAMIKMFMLVHKKLYVSAMFWTPYMIWLWLVFAVNWVYYQKNS